ncbi:MAG: hypothetical protein ACLS90_04390 [Clostridia bacterium]|jgi:hypothetical protein
MEVEDLLKYMHKFFTSIDQEINDILQELSNVDLEQQDILHYIENNNLNASGYAKVGKLLKEIRLKRRKIKNDLDKLSTIRDNLTRKYNNKFIEKDIIGAIKGIEAVEKREGKYNNRTNILDRLEAKDEQIQK